MIQKEFCIIGGQGDQRHTLQKLSADDVDAIQKSCAAIYKFGYYDKRDIEIQENLKEFLNVYHLSESDVTSKSDEELRNGIFNSIFINVNRTFTNYLSSYKIQVDHFDFHLKNKYGKESTEYLKFEGHKRATYDANLTHRLFYNLRNYSQHIYFPLNNITKDSIKEGEGFKHVMLVSFDKNELLKEDSIVKKLKADLEKCGDYIPVMPHVNNSKKILEDIFKMYMIIEKETLLSHVERLNKYISVVPTNMEPLYGYWERPTPTTGICRTNIFPSDIIERLTFRLKEMNL